MDNELSYNVGARFEYAAIIYEVRPEEAGCKGCAFYIQDEGECVKPDRIHHYIPCAGFRRLDETNVIFHQIGESEKAPDGNVNRVKNEDT